MVVQRYDTCVTYTGLVSPCQGPLCVPRCDGTQLVRAAVLTPATAGRRNRIWVATEVTDALDAFAERAGRRSLG